MISLSNSELTVSINSLGAELCRIKNNSTQQEYLWNAEKSIWGRHSPVLFPIVGKLKDNLYQVDGIEYTLPQHGFARDMEFKIKQQGSEEIVFYLEYSAETLLKYPYPFNLEITYTLKGNRINVAYSIRNLGDTLLYFSIGAHPGFNCPLLENESFEEYYLEFNKPETLELISLAGGLISRNKTPYLKNERKLKFTPTLFNNDALIFSEYTSDYISLKHQTKGEIFKFHFAGYPFLGIWSKPGPFICIEPWYGIADFTDHDGKFETKTGIQSLEPDREFTCEWGVEFNIQQN